MRSRNLVWLLSVLGAAVAALSSGCTAKGPEAMAPIPCYLESPGVMATVGRAVLVEPPSDPATATVARDLAQSMVRAMAARQIFQVDLATLGEAGLEESVLDGRHTVTLEQMKAMRSAFRTDVVILANLTEFHPYPRMRMGLRLRMIDLRSGQLIWSVDHVWDGTQEATARRIQQYHTTRTPGLSDPLEWRVALVSPKAFGEFVAADVAGTLGPTAVAARRSR
ncbi:MAG: hypothetical protein NTV86_21590 [Planctomycetota bacterium]|nr:hypothetical protein [Planctomycetota bacterium]